MAAQQLVERVLDRPELLERPLRVDRRVAGGEQHPVALAQRHVELLGQVQDHLLARARAAGLEEAQVARGDAGLEREVELAEAALGAPGLEEWPDSHYVER